MSGKAQKSRERESSAELIQALNIKDLDYYYEGRADRKAGA